LTFAVLLDAKQQPYGSVDRYPAGYYSPMLWAKGEVVLDSLVLPLEPSTPPGVYQLHLGLYQLADGQPRSLLLYQDGRPTGTTAVVIGPLKVGGPPPEVVTTDPSPQVIVNQDFGGQITLLGYDLELTPANEDRGQAPTLPNSESSASLPSNLPTLQPSTLHLTLYWRADTTPTTDYTTFLHLRNAANQTVAQKDSPPAHGRYPTSLWAAGEIIVDEIVLPLDQVVPGDYTPVVGLYELASGDRLPTPGHPANEVALQPVTLK
jgi:hypothetical protein